MKKIKKFLLRGTLLLIALLSLAHFAWMFSGSNQWELVKDENGVQVYTLKSPGSAVRKNMGIVRVQSTLSTIVKFMTDPDVCEDFGCYDAETIEWVDSQLQYYLFRMDYPLMFNTREFVVKYEFSQDPQSKELLLEVTATPDKIPPNDCCFRIKEMHNTWRFTPLENGEVEVEYVMDMDDDGLVPYFLRNTGGPIAIHSFFSRLQGLLNREKYQNAKFEFITEK